MASDGERPALALVLHLEGSVVAGEVADVPRDRVAHPLEACCPGAPDFLHLVNASVFDQDHRLLARHRALSVSRRAIRMAHEDDRAPMLARVKHFVSVEDYEHAREELDALTAQFEPDAECHYVAGLVAQGSERFPEAVEHFHAALGLTVDGAFRALVNRHLAELD